MSTYNRQAIAFESGQGSWLIAENGERYLDALSGISVCNIGHANAELGEAIRDQAGRLLHTSNLYRIPLQEQLAERLCDLSGMEKVFFCNSGAEANEAAIKICRKRANERKLENAVVVVMNGSFHGRTMATLSATGNVKVQEGFLPLLEGFHHVPYNDIEELRNLAEGKVQVVAVMLEPVQGEGGVVIPDPGYLQAVRQICDENDWLMVADEVQTGMCRTGEWFACQHENVVPDIMTLAKSLGNGVPIGACLARGEAAAILSPGTHGSTFGGNPLAARAALEVIDFMSRHKLAKRSTVLGRRLSDRIARELEGIDAVLDIRSKGLMLGIQLDRDCAELVQRALDDKLLINVTAQKVIRLLPPLTMDEEEMEILVTTLCKLVKDFVNEK